MNFGRRINLISSIMMLAVLGGLSNAYAESFEWDQDEYMIEHGGILTLILDSDPDPGNPNVVIDATVSFLDDSNPISVDLKRDTDTQFSSFFINFTTTGTGQNQFPIPAAEEPETDPPIGIKAEASTYTQITPTSLVSQATWPELKNVDKDYKGKTAFFVTNDVCFDLDLGGDRDGDGLCDYWEDNYPEPGLDVYLDNPQENYPLSCNEAFDFDGDSYITLDNQANFDFDISDSFSVAFWMNKTAGLGTDVLISKKPTRTGLTTGWELYTTNSDKIKFRMADGTVHIQAMLDQAVADGTWHYIVAVWNGTGIADESAMKFYVDGALATATDMTSNTVSTISNTHSVIIGAAGDANYKYNGQIDLLRIYDYALTADQLYTFTSIPPIALYEFDHDVNDYSGNANDGTVNGVQAFTAGPNGSALDFISNPLGDLACPDPDKADIFYEIDWMVGHTPSKIALDQVVNAFEKAEFFAPNPPYAKGINLHIQLDEGDLPHVDDITNPGGPRGGYGTDALKKFWYGTLAERGGITFPTAWTGPERDLKNYAFHYALFTHDLDGDPGTSGFSEFPGNDVMVSLGSWDGAVGSPDTQAGTLLHEIGHNMGLDHGGYDDVNCKPNYVSVMSFTRQTSDLLNREVQLSQVRLNDLDEALQPPQTQAIGQGAPWFFANITYSNSEGEIFYTVNSDASWDFGTPTDLNKFPDLGCPNEEDSDWPGEMDILYTYQDYENPNWEFVSWGHANWKDGVTFPSTMYSSATRVTGDYDMSSTITNIQYDPDPFKGDIETAESAPPDLAKPIPPEFDKKLPPKVVCINFHSNAGKAANPAKDRICIGNELKFQDVIKLRGGKVTSIGNEISKIPNGHFVVPSEASSFKKEYLQQLEIIKDHVNTNNMSEAIRATIIFQSWFDGEGEKEYIKNDRSREKIFNLASDMLDAQLTVVPEFETLAIVVLSISIITVIALTGRSKLSFTRINQ